jgi:hypothetical protein
MRKRYKTHYYKRFYTRFMRFFGDAIRKRRVLDII